MDDSMPGIDVGTIATLGRGSLTTLSAFRHATAAPHRDPDEESFSAPTVIFTTAGRWAIRSSVGRTDVDPSVVVLGAAGRAYRARHDEQVPTDRTLFLRVRPPEVASAFGDDADTAVQDAFARQCVPRTRAIARIQAAMTEPAAGAHAGLRLDALAMELLVELARAEGPSAPARPTIHPDVLERLIHVREYLDAHLAEPVDLAMLARVASLSPFYLARRFREAFGEPPHRYLVERRLERAAELLRTTSLTVTQVCDRVGFGSPAHFASAFRRRHGMPPSAYRAARP